MNFHRMEKLIIAQQIGNAWGEIIIGVEEIDKRILDICNRLVMLVISSKETFDLKILWRR